MVTALLGVTRITATASGATARTAGAAARPWAATRPRTLAAVRRHAGCRTAAGVNDLDVRVRRTAPFGAASSLGDVSANDADERTIDEADSEDRKTDLNEACESLSYSR